MFSKHKHLIFFNVSSQLKCNAYFTKFLCCVLKKAQQNSVSNYRLSGWHSLQNNETADMGHPAIKEK